MAGSVVLRNIIVDCEKAGADGIAITSGAAAVAIYLEDVVGMNCPANAVSDVRTAAGASLFIKNSTFRGIGAGCGPPPLLPVQ
jgi:hypothetical protein